MTLANGSHGVCSSLHLQEVQPMDVSKEPMCLKFKSTFEPRPIPWLERLLPPNGPQVDHILLQSRVGRGWGRQESFLWHH